MNKIIMILSLMIAASQVSAKEAVPKKADSKGIDTKQIYFGGGLGLNDANFGDNAMGFQIFAGLPIPVQNKQFNLGVEIGYMDSGSFDKNVPFLGKVSAKANGLWGTAVVSVPLQDKLDLIGRFGLDIGDDDGLMLGAGVGFTLSNNMDLRAEYVIRDTIDSLQVNLVIRQ